MTEPVQHGRHVALVTGANTGIGAAIAERLAREGFAVLVAYLAFEEPEDAGLPERLRANHRRDASGVLERIEAAGGQATAVAADLADAASVPLLFDAAERAFDRQFGVDARAGALLIAEFATRLQARGGDWGRIITMTSGGERGFPQEVSYGAAKAAIVNYTLSASLELARFGVTANALHPPVTDTGWVTDDVREAVAVDDNFFSVAAPEEVADVVAFLVSEAGRRVTGNVIRMG